MTQPQLEDTFLIDGDPSLSIAVALFQWSAKPLPLRRFGREIWTVDVSMARKYENDGVEEWTYHKSDENNPLDIRRLPQYIRRNISNTPEDSHRQVTIPIRFSSQSARKHQLQNINIIIRKRFFLVRKFARR